MFDLKTWKTDSSVTTFSVLQRSTSPRINESHFLVRPRICLYFCLSLTGLQMEALPVRNFCVFSNLQIIVVTTDSGFYADLVIVEYREN